ncbi:DUF6968 family protein [Devosia sp.]|uniref:DUF6968 family protein n=1 Tax=Devosia sp. TaxID=1871048 RepID=UPI003265B200
MSDRYSPILRRLVVDGTPERAFLAFVNGISVWWPKGFSANGENLTRVTIELTPGGRVFETGASGAEISWGSVTDFEPGVRIVMAWWLGLTEAAPTVIEVVFAPALDGTEIGFIHRGWGNQNVGQHGKFDAAEGWDRVLHAYRDYARWHAARVGPDTTTTIIASRRLWIATEAVLTPVDIRFFLPLPADGSWGCRYEIDWPERRRVFTMFGADGVQALYLAMSMVGSEVYGSDYHDDGTLMFDRPGAGYGFPVSANDRDQLIGHDRQFF